MSLQLILGNSGSGKTRRLYETVIRESLERPDETFLVIVPEQFTLQTQRELVELHPDHGILNIDVLSFQRLAWKVFEETGVCTSRVLEETGKNLLLRKTAQEKKDALRVLCGSMKKQGYITEVKSLISEFVQYDISPEELLTLAEGQKDRPSLYYKLLDVQVLYAAFTEKLKGGYITAEEVLTLLAQHAHRSGLLKGCTIALDGYTGFTPIQSKLLLELFKLAKKVYLTVTVDVAGEMFTKGPMHELFYLSRRTICAVTDLARQAGCRAEEPVIAGSGRHRGLHTAPALDFLEQHLYRGGRRGRKVFSEVPEEILCRVADTPAGEAEAAAREIWHLVREKKWHYGEIAVICGDLGAYANSVRRVFTRTEIPFFIDETKKILLNPALELLKAALSVARQNYARDAVMRFLRTGFAGVTQEEADVVENYLRAAGIRGKSQWEKPWERTTKTCGEELVRQAEALRVRIIGVLMPFTEGMKGRRRTARQLAEALYGLCVRIGLQEQLHKREQELLAAGNPERALEYRQVYGIIMDLLDKLVELLGEEILSAEEFTEILEAGFEEARTRIIPPEPDRVLVGDIERTRLKNIRALFFLGLNDGLVPMGAAGAGFLSDAERELLKDGGASLAPGVRESSCIQRFYLYQHMTKPSERLWLSYARAGMDGAPIRPSGLIAQIRRLFPKMEVREACGNPAEGILSPGAALPWFSERIPQLLKDPQDPVSGELYRWYLRDDVYRERVLSLVRASFEGRTERGLGRAVARALYGRTLENSVSRLERYAACAYAHFLMYGLRLSEREEYVFAPVDMGNVFHAVLELFSERLSAGGYTWYDVPRGEQERLVTECLNEVAEGYGGQILGSSARGRFSVVRMERILQRTVWALCEQVRRGGFVPANFEVPFQTAELAATNLRLSDGSRMRLRGRIDRIDVCEEEDRVYVKVIDYKSGSTAFDLEALYYGLQLQLAVYLNAAMELEQRIRPGREILPAGIFYYHVKDPMLKKDARCEEEDLERDLLRALRPDGVVNADPDVIRRMDRTMERESDVIPAGFNKDGSLSARSRVLTKEQFAAVTGYVTKKLSELGSEILEGKTDVRPYERKDRTACDVCAYREVCCFDTKRPGDGYRRLRELEPEEILARMEAASEEEKGGTKDGDGLDA